MFFSAQGGVSQPSARLPFRVGYHVCPAHLGLPRLHPSLTFDRDTDIQSFKYFFRYKIGQMKRSRKQKSLALIFIYNEFFSEH